MHKQDELILELSALCGIVPEYWDIFGTKHVTTIETRKAVLRAMGFDIDSMDDLLREIRERTSRPWKDLVEPVHVLSVNAQPLAIPVYIPIDREKESALTISWCLENEEKTYENKNFTVVSGADLRISETRRIDGLRYIKLLLVDPAPKAIGYYTFRAEFRHPEKVFPGSSDSLHVRSRVILTPDSCYIPPELEEGKAWGLSINLYALRSEKNWGAGDFADLRHVVRWLAGARGSFVGINPLHAIPNTAPFGVSPYAPLSRLYKNHIYLDIERIPEVAESSELQKFISSGRFRFQLDKLRREKVIDYEAVAALKEKAIRKAFNFFLKKHLAGETERGMDFRSYLSGEGRDLELFAVFMALQNYMRRKKNVYSWRDWPDEFQHADGEAVTRFKKMHSREVLFYQYVQWLIDGQLRALRIETEKLRMKIGLFFDLAVGSVGGGSDAWSHREVMAHGANVGAPPDDFSPDGQKWGFPSLIPEKMKESGYELFIRTIQKNMKYGGAIRIDHALGLFRTFWIPDGLSPRDGAYVRQPSEDLLRIIALESVRNRTMVIAEDLGTIGDNVREALKRYRMLSYRLFYFERNYPDPSFLSPDKYPEMALCAVTTHDLPTIYGYWRGRDIEIRNTLAGGSSEGSHKRMHERERDKKLILSALRSQGLFPDDREAITDMTPDLCLAIYRYLARTPCKLLLVSLDDVIGTLDQQNLPGTLDEHPNWIQKTPVSLETILNDRRLSDLAEALSGRALGKKLATQIKGNGTGENFHFPLT